MITTWCQLVVLGAISLRAASRALTIIASCFNLGENSIPSWYTGRLWLMRLGYYKLYREKVKANDWIWIIDHSVQTGEEKCLDALAPPAQRSKARYMNTEYLLGWGKNMLVFLSQSNEALAQMNYDVAKVVEKLGWLREFDSDINY